MTTTAHGERPRLLVLDLLESYARERGAHVVLERVNEGDEWICVLRNGEKGLAVRCIGKTAREAIIEALREMGVEIPE
jgi:hypothetical protein